MAQAFTKNTAEDTVIAWLENLGYTIKHNPEIVRCESAAERQNCGWLHNTLLPKLISGELRAKDTQRFIADAAP
jgi:hypothetical protein